MRHYHGKKAVTGSHDHTCMIWDLETGKPIGVLKGHSGNIFKVCITPDGKRIITISNDKSCMIWDLDTRRLIGKLKGHTDTIKTICFTPDGSFVITGSFDNTCILWNLLTLNPIIYQKAHSGHIKSINITPDGMLAFSSSSNERTFTLWRLDDGQVLQTFQGHSGSITSICVTPDGKKVLSCSLDHTCILWDIRTGKNLRIFKGCSGAVYSAMISSDGNRVIPNSYDETCVVWDIENGNVLAQYPGNYIVMGLNSTPNAIIYATNNSQVTILKSSRRLLCPEAPIVTARKIWDYELNKFFALSVDCPLCGNRFEPEASIVEIINSIARSYTLRPNQSPCLELPVEAWEVPGLLSNCTNCGEVLRFNPFIPVDINEVFENQREESLIRIAEQSYNKGYWEAAIASLQKFIAMGETSDNILEMLITSMLSGYKNLSERNLFEIEQYLQLLDMNGKTDKANELRVKLNNKIKPEAPVKKKLWWKK